MHACVRASQTLSPNSHVGWVNSSDSHGHLYVCRVLNCLLFCCCAGIVCCGVPQIGHELDQLERQMLGEDAAAAAGPSTNLDESGMFSVQVGGKELQGHASSSSSSSEQWRCHQQWQCPAPHDLPLPSP